MFRKLQGPLRETLQWFISNQHPEHPRSRVSLVRGIKWALNTEVRLLPWGRIRAPGTP